MVAWLVDLAIVAMETRLPKSGANGSIGTLKNFAMKAVLWKLGISGRVFLPQHKYM